MKGVIVFNQLNDIVFVHHDVGFGRYVNSKWCDGQCSPTLDPDGPLDTNILMQMFSPLISSQRFMTEEARNPCQSIQCANNFLFVLEQYHDHMLMAICGDGLETEAFMRRKLLVLQRILRFLFGPCDEEIKLETARGRDLRWHFISKLLDTWIELYNSEQCFLIEAIERLHVNQLLNVKCIELMEMVLSVLKSSGETNVLHAFTIVNCKLLSLFSVRNAFELLPSDMLLIVLLVKSRFTMNQRLEDFFSESVAVGDNEALQSPVPDNEHYQSAPEDHDQNESEDVDELFSSVPSSPAQVSDCEKAGDDQKDIASGQETDWKEVDAEKEENYLLQTVLASVNDPTEENDYQTFTAMLGTPQCKYTPHTLHCIQVMPGIVVIVISETKNAKHSGAICQTISIMRALLHQAKGSTLQGKQTIEFLDHNIKKIFDITKRQKINTFVGKILSDVHSKWELCKHHGLARHLDNIEGNELGGRLIGALSTIVDKLKILFRILFVSKSGTCLGQPARSETISRCQQTMQRQLYDYKDYLAVKAQRNITMTNFVEDYPGLVHFIYVDRSMSQMTCPSINIGTGPDLNRVDIMAVIKKKLWTKIEEIQTRLKKGHLTQIVRQGDFLYSYFLWFEDGAVQPLIHQRQCEPVTESILPGLLAGGFYRHIIRQIFPSLQQHNIRAYELFMMHVAVVPTQYALHHGKKLAVKMLETTGQANSPINLL